MESQPKKRSLFAFTGLFRSSSMPTDERNVKAESSTKAAQPEFTNASAPPPQSPVKRASESQLATRKMIARPQGPSSKLSQSVSASDYTRLPSTTVVATPRRMPGDNPYKLPPSSATPAVSHAPPNNSTTNFTRASSTPRNIFRSSALYSRPGLSTFSPRVPANTLTQSFPPNTPGRTPRGSTADVNGRILAHTSSTELFKMRIPSPPRHLSGEALAKEVPEDPHRTGSIYADEYLAHYCPPDFDELQRRQFFCILDLRRLKYAADEVFTKKDWKINIMNFAKEYEKSRSLIMLRYGLYEFKTVRPSEAVKKEWKQKHGIPDTDDEAEPVPKANGGAKRKAEEELTPSSNVLMSSVSGGHKRARAPEMPAKNKRKAEVMSEPDENHPAKLQKPAPTPQRTSSATKSVFESIANNAQISTGASTTAAKAAPKSTLFGSSTGPKPNGSLGRSVFEAASTPAGAATNIFSHLSDESKGSGNEGADEESETSINADEDQSDEHAASGGVSTPQFTGVKTETRNGSSSASSEAGESTQGRSLFERITRNSDGQPIRKLPPGDGGVLFPAVSVKDRSASPSKDQPAVAPGNQTWNANTPIKFSAPASTVFGSAATKPAASSTVDFGASAAKKAEEAPAAAPTEASKEKASQNIFGASTKTEDASGTSAAAPAAPASNIFSAVPPKSTDAPAAAAPAFGGLSASTSATPSLFGSTTPASGQQKEKEGAKDSGAPTGAAPSTLFGTKATSATSETQKPNIFQASTLFGSQTKTDPTAAAPPKFGSLFGKTQTADSQAEKPVSSLLPTDSARSAGNIFGTGTAATGTSTEEPAAKKFAFGSSETKPGSSLFGYAASTPPSEPAKPTETKTVFAATSMPAAPATETKSIFGNLGTAAPTSAAEAKPLFGTTTGATETKPLFGSTTGAMETKPLFGNTQGTTEPKPLFGNTAAATETKPNGGLFGGTTTAAPASSAAPTFSFGTSQAPAASQPAATQPSGSIFGIGGSASFTFSAGGSDGTTINNPFATNGSSSAPPSFNFGSSSAPPSFNFGSGDSQSSTNPFQFGGGTNPTISFGGTSDAGASGSQQTNTGSLFNFGASPQPSGPSLFSQNPPAAASSIFGSSLAPGGGTSTGTNTPFTFGGASSLATTPAATTPEPSANAEDGQGTNADGDEAPQEQISLTDGGPGEEDESVVHEVRAKAVKLVTGGDSDEDSGSNVDKKKSPWRVQGVGPLRLLKHKTTGSVRMVLRAEPRGHLALNKLVLPNFSYKVEPSGSKYVKVTTATDDGKGLETWMLQVKTPAAAQALAESLEEHKKANEKIEKK
ncbi:hypothetical protein VTK56DRAFT_7789 [Thermocarpiscus australiensis]